VTVLDDDPLGAAGEAAAALASHTGRDRHDVAVVLGSGWAPAADVLAAGSTVTEVRLAYLPYFVAPSVEGHGGVLRSFSLGDKAILTFLGRSHLYEGRGVEPVVHPIRTAVAAGCSVVVLTNACGGIRADLRPGQAVLVSDHISLTATSPLVGAQFVDLTDLYSRRLRDLCHQVDPTLPEGVYCHWRGPAYETPAEIRMMRTLGADLVGMSTVPEAIAAHALGAEVLAISLVTNPAAGLSGERLDHADVLRAGQAAADDVGRLLAKVIGRL
jgi:purine-nucleoside phosphorylase